jgi:hypothetical protein
MGNRGKREFIQALRLMEVFPETVVAAAALDAIRLGAISFDAVNLLDRQGRTQTRKTRSRRLSLSARRPCQDDLSRRLYGSRFRERHMDNGGSARQPGAAPGAARASSAAAQIADFPARI